LSEPRQLLTHPTAAVPEKSRGRLRKILKNYAEGDGVDVANSIVPFVYLVYHDEPISLHITSSAALQFDVVKIDGNH
jgi:hypothetical protein